MIKLGSMLWWHLTLIWHSHCKLYCHTIWKQHTMIKNKYLCQLTYCIILLHDIASPHTAHVMGGSRISCVQLGVKAMHFSCLWIMKGSSWWPYVHVRQWHAGDCGIVVEAADQRILSKWDMLACASVGPCLNDCGYQCTLFIKSAKGTFFIGTNIKWASPTCFGTCIPSSGQSQFLKAKSYCKTLV
jgi:hypothetical protein